MVTGAAHRTSGRGAGARDMCDSCRSTPLPQKRKSAGAKRRSSFFSTTSSTTIFFSVCLWPACVPNDVCSLPRLSKLSLEVSWCGITHRQDGLPYAIHTLASNLVIPLRPASFHLSRRKLRLPFPPHPIPFTIPPSLAPFCPLLLPCSTRFLVRCKEKAKPELSLHGALVG